MSVYKRPDSDTYSYDFQFQGARYSGNTGEPSKRKAEQYVEALKRTLKSNNARLEKPFNFGAAWSLYWEEIGQHHTNAEDTLRALEWLEKQIGRATMIAAITDSTVARLVTKRRAETFRGKPISPSTVNRTVTEPLKAILRRAGDIWGQSVQRIRWKDHTLKEPQERIREASKDEEDKFLAAIREDYRPVFQFAILTGCRVSEIIGLEWTRVDFFSRYFTVIGKGDKTRRIPMTKAVYALLWSQRGNHALAVFTYIAWKTRDGRERKARYPITINGFKTQWRRAKKTAGVPDFRFHDTRHTAATRLVRKSGNLKLAQRLLGHSDIATTSRYSHVTDDDLRAAMEDNIPTEIPTDDAGGGDKGLSDKGNVV